MFAVKGWSVAPGKLRKESLTQAAANAASEAKASGEPPAPVKKPRKRKRAGAGSQDDVNVDNVADMWESVIEGKGASKKAKKGVVSQQQKDKAAGDGNDVEGGDQAAPTKKQNQKAQTNVQAADKQKSQPLLEAKQSAKKTAKKEGRKKGQQSTQAMLSSDSSPAPAPTPAPAALAPLPIPSAKLTPLQRAMRAKLIPARFRHLNETLYTRPSEEALKLFSATPELFEEYHAGFRQQVEVWPENPVDGYVALVRERAAHRAPYVRRGAAKAEKPSYASLAVTPLPRTQGTCVMADMGCGDAKLAQALQSDTAGLRVRVHSFDLHSPSPLVTAADIANVPLDDGAADVVVFCLALMGTNWLDFIDEAYRILHWKGELWVSEIKSRFGRVGGPASNAAPGRNVVSHSVGNRKKAAAVAKKPSKEDKEKQLEGQHKELAIEVDGEADRRQETDVSAFVGALQKRGFVLHGEPDEAVDLSNRMFVKMHFIKAAPPVKGKNVDKYGKPANGQQKKKWPVGKDEHDEELDEDAILKPCVYKLR
ncbi:25S rRNA (adenine(645)-N(1))-methyltransferase [Ceratocystis lukuohia]|uniref:Ribosomal RNA-processing protein 8 n=2 Tax=Ceratocystis TaxID=5157 RepID=A0A0F8DLF8_CERFI|nr:25S rRNA (adenine(645)-N(1))-methyltransferase [Ceratocystis platani]